MSQGRTAGQLAGTLPERSVLIILASVLGYAVGLVVVYRRWRATGVVALAALLAAADLARGSWAWSQPHDDMLPFPREHDWACHSLGLLPPLAILTPVALAALWLIRRAAPDGTPPGVWRPDSAPCWWPSLSLHCLPFGYSSTGWS